MTDVPALCKNAYEVYWELIAARSVECPIPLLP